MPEHTPLHGITAQAGAAFVEDTGWLIPDHFGDLAAEYRQARGHAVLFDLSHYGKVEVTGADAGSFLHNLSTNDVTGRTVGSAGTCHVRRHDALGVPGYDIVCLRGRAEAVWQMLTRSGAQPAGKTVYEALRIEAGTPLYGLDIDENTLAPEVGRNTQAI